MSKTKVPAIPSPTDDNLREVARAVKGILDVREGLAGDPLDKAVTFRELSEGGLIETLIVGRNGVRVSPAPGLGSGGGGGSSPELDLTPPPAPTGLAATGSFAAVILQWGAPPGTYAANHAFTEIWRAETNAIGNAVRIGTTQGELYVDYLGNNVTRFYWVRFRSKADVAGPYNATNGVSATTAQNPNLLLNSLTTAITSGQLAASLGDRINLIDGADTVPGSVNARVKTVETEKIGYCSLAGVATDHTNKAACEAAGGTWSVGLPLATAVKQVSISDGTSTAALEQRFTAQKATNDGLLAQYSIKVDLAGHVSGFGLSSTLNNATPFSEFGVRADRFWIAPPAFSSATAPTTGLYKGYVWRDTGVNPAVTRYWSGAAWTTTPQNLPFVVATSPTTINGVTVPAGVYIDTAMIADATITSAKIGTAAIDDAKIASLSASKITAGSMQVGSYIQSSNYIPGNSGWKINADGGADLSDAAIRGAIYGGSAAGYASGVGFFSGLALTQALDGDPAYNSVSLLLHGDGTNNSTTFTDSGPTPKTPTIVGQVIVSTSRSRFGGASINFIGNPAGGNTTGYISGPTPTPASFGVFLDGGYYAGMVWQQVTQSNFTKTLATGIQTFTVPNAAVTPLFYIGQLIEVRSRSDPAGLKFVGTVLGAAGTTLTLNVTSIVGTGTASDWSIMSRYRIIVSPKAQGLSTTRAMRPTGTIPTTLTACRNLSEGFASTEAMRLNGTSTTYPLAHWARGLNINGYTDWYIPSRDEIEVCARNLSPRFAGQNATSATQGDRLALQSHSGNGSLPDLSTSTSYGQNRNSEPAGSAYTATNPGTTSSALFLASAPESFADENTGPIYYTSTISVDGAAICTTNFDAYGPAFGSSIHGVQTMTASLNSSYWVRAIRRSII